MEDQRKEKWDKLEELSKPLIKYLNNNWNPHTKIIINCDSAEIVCGEMRFKTDEFILD